MGTKKKFVLIVDDSPENIKLIGTLLIKHGFDVGAATNGPGTLAFVKKEEPDLILMDIMMPGMNGFEVCEKLKANPATKHIPVIFLTAKRNTEDIVKGFKSGGVDYVSKPFNSEELLARVNTHIEIKILRGFLPICSSCKSIRDDDGYWHSIERYIEANTAAVFSHSLCSKCTNELYGKDFTS
ncbi:MAG: response regulator [bacterium]|nr:response regulator [bacterium]